MPGWEMSKRAVRSFTAASPRVSDSKIARRLGSTSAWKILLSAPTARCIPINKLALMNCQACARGSNSSTGLPDGSSRMTCAPPGPVTISLSEQEAHAVPHQGCERGRGIPLHGETEKGRIEVHRRRQGIDYVAHADARHRSLPLLSANSPLFPSLAEQTLREIEPLLGFCQLLLEVVDAMLNCFEPLGDVDRG